MLRAFAIEDQEAVRALILAGMRERWGAEFDPSANPDVYDIWTSYVGRGAEVIVVEAHGDIVATGSFVCDVDRVGRIVRMAVDPRHRRQGLARMVVAELVERAGDVLWIGLVVSTDTPWSSAVALYRSCGFDLVEQTAEATHFSLALVTA